MFPIDKALKTLLATLPAEARPFSGSEIPLPVRAAYLADKPLDLPALGRTLASFHGSDVKPAIDPVLLCAEAVESVQPDRETYFIVDRSVQEYVFTGSKWRAGWALVLGAEGSEGLIRGLQEREFMVFTDLPGIKDTRDIGPRETSPIYFLQLMIRYGLTWGRIRPGDDHELGHYLEKDMPGVLIVRRDLPPLKYLVALGLMKLGAPALVPSTFPFPYGNRVVADTDSEILQRINGFENLRTRTYGDETISLPDYANTAFTNQEFPATGRLGGTPLSFLCMWPARMSGAAGDAEEVPASSPDIGILIDVREKEFTVDISAVMERAAIRALSFVDRWRARESDEGFLLEWASDAPFAPEKAREAMRAGIRLQYPGLVDFDVRIVRDRDVLSRLAPLVARFKKERHGLIASMTEENTELFAACTECRPFSLVHTCIITPDRTPMCASRTYFTVKASSLFGSDTKPWKRRSEQAVPLRSLFERGDILDLARGEYRGVNDAYRTLTGARSPASACTRWTRCPTPRAAAFRISPSASAGTAASAS